MRVAIAHDWLMQFAGSERCVSELLKLFPRARLLTTLMRPEGLPPELRVASPSFLQHVPGAVDHHEWMLPAMPLAWRLRRLPPDLDLVVSSSHACAKAIRTAEGIPHLCYCHTPMRYAWAFDDERERFPAPLRGAARVGMSAFRRWDRAAAANVTLFVANSSAVAGRIDRAYSRSARVVYPPVDTDFYCPAPRERSHFVYVGRLTGYKRPEVVVRAFAGLPYRLTVVGDGPLRGRLEELATPNVSFRGAVPRGDLRELYRTSTAMVFPVNEDFGIAMAEAQACGTPVIGLAEGGALDIVEPGRTGWLIERQGVDEVRAALRRAADEMLDPAYIAERAQRFSAARFRHEIAEIVTALRNGADESDFT